MGGVVSRKRSSGRSLSREEVGGVKLVGSLLSNEDSLEVGFEGLW